MVMGLDEGSVQAHIRGAAPLADPQPRLSRRAAVRHLLLATSVLALTACQGSAAPNPGPRIASTTSVAVSNADIVERVAAWVRARPSRSWNNDWGETVQMYGLAHAGQVLHSPASVEYVTRWATERVAAGVTLTPPTSPIDWNRYYTGPQMHITGYCGSWGCDLVVPALQNPRPALQALQQQIISYITTTADRTGEGGLRHGGGRETYCLDTLYFSVPGLAHWGARHRDTSTITDGARQVTLHAHRLQDTKTGLFYHAWNEPASWTSSALWARGNGWVAMTLAEWLTVAPANHPDRAAMRAFLERLVQALLPLQTPGGLWRTVLDRADSYEETSASAMFTFAIARAIRLGLLDTVARRAAVRCRTALQAYVAADGAVTGVSAGTDPGDAIHYMSIPRGTYPWGTGAWLLAVAECALLDTAVNFFT